MHAIPVWTCIISLLAAASLPAVAAEKDAAPKPAAAPVLAPEIQALGQLVGGAWNVVPREDGRSPRVELRFEWVFNHTAIRGHGTVQLPDGGTLTMESTVGWDPVAKAVYYIDFHGSQTVYKGTVARQGDTFVWDFGALIGAPGHWRSVSRFQDRDTYVNTITAQKDGKWVEVESFTLKRRR